MFLRDSTVQLNGYSDANRKVALTHEGPFQGNVFFLGKSFYYSRIKKHLLVSKSSSEAEYHALPAATCELQWMFYLIKDLQAKCIETHVIYCDSQSILNIAYNKIFHKRVKHLKIDCHIVREKQASRVMKILLVKSKGQLAYFFLKIIASSIIPYSFTQIDDSSNNL